jgi:hypothetical protein
VGAAKEDCTNLTLASQQMQLGREQLGLFFKFWVALYRSGVVGSVAEPLHFYAAPAPAPGKNFDAAPDPAALAPAPAPTLPYSRAKFLKRTKV